ncbi:Ger(x)C family spore germination protein [Neobacillus sp. MM2021_6]|uniref:Ger(x)C family spore germination protein n=1 Tax=Bacillaceae TaxID=186817 RepID=UPI00140D296A|nr:MULTISPECIES: Ger(x)C family spore germination protein [Bacillaceae]MBO0962125.1 Ger(x)C family spore germination protein [Neobacillus sp. MM2021_6]NHC20975.1 Ger(x)C family spore germination protein [Bacillus sp. MM2020_4]
MKPFKLFTYIPLTCCLLSMTLTLSGCWDYKDINHRALPITMGISKEDDDYKVFLKIPESEQPRANMEIVSAKGETITQAVDNISRNMEDSVDLLHVKVILIDRALAEQGVKDIISGFVRSRDIPEKALIAIFNGDLAKFFSKTKKGGITTYEFFEKDAGWTPEIALTRVWEVYRSINSYTRDTAVPLIQRGKRTPVEQIGSAIIRKGKMVDQISSEETLLFNAFKGESTQGKIEVLDHASVLIISNSMDNKVKLIEKTPFMQSRINLKVRLMETRGNPSPSLIKKELTEILTNRFNQLFTKMQKREADILGLGQFYRNEIPKEELKNWRSDYLPNMKLDTQFHIVIVNEGFLK